MQLKTLGTLEVVHHTRPDQGDSLAQPKRAGVLLYLALAQPPGWKRRDTLVALLWPELDQARARNALSQALHHLRRSLGPETILGQGAELVTLDATRMSCDALELERLARAGQYPEALALYRGDLAPGFHVSEAPEFDRWLDGERSRYRDLAFEAARSLAAVREKAGDLGGASEALHRAVDLRPEAEGALRELMQLLDRAGDRASALEIHADVAGRLRREFDIELSAETDSLAARLRTRPPSAPARVASPEHSAPAARIPLPTPPTPVASSRPRRGAAFAVLILLAVVIIGLTGGRRMWGTRRGGSGNDALIVIAPFRLNGTEPALGYLREGLMDLLAARLDAGGTPRALDPRAVLAAWRNVGGSDSAELQPDDAQLVSERLGAGRLVLGAVVGRADRLAITATLRTVPESRELAVASAEGPADSLPELVDRIAAQLLARDAGESEQRLSGVSRTSLAALRPYLAGQAAFRAGRYEEAVTGYEQALAADSTFTLAALGLAASGIWVPSVEAERRHGLALAWAGRDRLPSADRAYLFALAGPRYPAEPTARERLAAWEAAVSAAPERPDVWYEYGDILFHKGSLLGIRGARSLARTAFQRAVQRDSSYAPAVLHLYEVEMADGDAADAVPLAERYLAGAPSGEHADFLRWRNAVAKGDSAERARLRASFTSLPFGSLWRIIGTSQLEGIALEDADFAAKELTRRIGTRDEQSESAGYLAELALNRGRPREAARLASLLSLEADGHVLIDALYGDGDTAAAVAAARNLERSLRQPLAADSAQRSFQLFDRCALAQWGLWRGDSTNAAQIERQLRSVNDGNAPWWAVGRIEVCAALVDALRAVSSGSPGAAERVAALDSVLVAGLEVGIREPGNLASARLHERLGDLPGALAALERREYHHRTGIPYLAARCRDEGRIAASLGKREQAIAAFEHYLALRSDPAPERRAQADTVRAWLTALGP
jgi:DNA-binding SARP family transcriptional activator